MSGSKFDVIVIGELNADLVLSGDVSPAFGQVEKLVETADLTVGSSGGIFACGAARLGLRVASVGVVGPDPFGRFMLDESAARGVDISAVRVDPSQKTGLSVILARGNDRAILTFPGSIPALRYEDIDLTLLDNARHLHLASYYLLDALRMDIPRLFREAHRRGLTVSLDTNYDPSGRWDGGIEAALAEIDLFLPNETELIAISRAGGVEEGLARLADKVPLVVVKRGPDGAFARQGEQVFRASSMPIQVVDTVGAGDSFDAGMIYGYLQDRDEWPVEKALRLACVCGALSTRAAGGTNAQATLEEALHEMRSEISGGGTS